jgi:hypothetical protein
VFVDFAQISAVGYDDFEGTEEVTAFRWKKILNLKKVKVQILSARICIFA